MTKREREEGRGEGGGGSALLAGQLPAAPLAFLLRLKTAETPSRTPDALPGLAGSAPLRLPQEHGTEQQGGASAVQGRWCSKGGGRGSPVLSSRKTSSWLRGRQACPPGFWCQPLVPPVTVAPRCREAASCLRSGRSR